MLSSNLFATLLLAHLLADFPLQTNLVIRLKNRYGLGILLHVAIHITVSALLLRFQREAGSSYLLILTFIGISHFVIDWLKSVIGSSVHTLRMFLVDQYLHVLSLVAAIGICKLLALPMPISIVPEIWLLYALALAFCLALMVMGWVWINTLDRRVIHQNRALAWSQQRLLLIEQRVGMLLLIGLGMVIFFPAL